MKKILSLALCVLLAGSAMLQSCSKPDAATNAPDPVNPIVPAVPVDSTKTGSPVIPLTKAEIIQRALKKLQSDTFNFSSFERVVRRTIKTTSGNNLVVFTELQNLPPTGLVFPYGVIQENGIMVVANAPRTGIIRASVEHFYNKIFVNAAGDSFIGATNVFYAHLEDSNSITAAAFTNLNKFKTLAVDSNATYSLLPAGYPTVEAQYYYNKDSLSMYRTLTDYYMKDDSSATTTGFNVIQGKRKK